MKSAFISQHNGFCFSGQFYVIFTGKEKVPERISLKEEFFRNAPCAIDLTAKVYTAETDDIIGQYIIFCRVLDDQIKKYGKTKEAPIEAIRICRDRGVLVEYLNEREMEVVDIMVMLFDQEYAVQQYAYSQREEGKKEGILGAVDICREINMDDRSIIAAIRKRFNLSEKDAEKYVLAPAGT